MAECSYARCVQERRAIKKELQRWTKNMVFVVGLERVAEELMGRRKWKQYQDLVLKTPLKVDIEPEIQDWEPQEKCCMCDGKAFLDSATSLVASESGSSGPNSPDSSSLRETPPVTLPHESSQSSAAPNNNVLPSLSSLASTSAAMTTLQSVTSMAASLAAVAALSSNSSHSNTGNIANNPMIPGVTTPPGAMPFYPPPPHHHGGLFPHWYLSPPQSHLAGRTLSPAAMSLAEGLRLEGITSTKQDHSTTPPIVMALPPSASAPEQPLDLSAKPVVCASGAGDSNARDSNSELVSQATQQQSSQSLRVPSIDNKHIFKAKPRMSTVAGRRTYTEEELQAALRDIQSGKLGTRRAAVIYGIPRSTLRNKVYKLALERERDSHLVIGNNISAPVTLVNVSDKSLEPELVSKAEDVIPEDDEKELSGAEEEREVEKALQKPLLSMEDLVRFSVLDAGKGIGSLLQQGRALEDGLRKHSVSGEEGETCTSPPVFPNFPQNITELWNGMEHSALGPYVSQLLATGIIGSKNPGGGTLEDRNTGSATAGDFLPKFPSPLLPEFVHRMIEEERILIGEQLKKQHAAGIGNFKPNFHPNGAHASEESVTDSEKLTLRPPGGVSSAKESTAEDSTNIDTFPPSSEATTSGMVTPPSNVILKIPSFKPTSKNGVASGSGGSGNTAESLFPVSQFQRSSSNPSAVATLHESSSQPFISSPVIGAARSGSESSSPPAIPPSLVGKGIGVSLRDMIVKSINQKFQHHGSNEVPSLHIPPKMLLGHESGIEPPFKRGRFTPPLCSSGPSITTSVIKHNNNSQSDDRHAQKISAQLLNKPSSTSGGIGNGGNQGNSTGGKGTRPKRGKYRNYDRDSLIEAVRAVQRGEMSVHRAGSHFGVPHSTLEYKVKERHLMRPRKREPKPQLEDPKKKDDIRQPLPNLDKTKIPPKTPKAPFTPASPGLPNAPNGLKLSPLFDPASMPPMAYAAAPPFPFWPPNPFHSLPIPDFPHSGTGNTQVGYSPTPEFFASQMMQRLQEGSSRVHAGGGGRANSPSGTPTCSRSPPVTNTGGTLGKSAREMAESLYDGTGANGSFLDGIIRSSLEMGLPHGVSKDSNNTNAPENLSNKALLDQLCRNSRLTPLPRAMSLPVNDGGASSSDDDSIKRSSSRNAFVPGSIKTAATESDASMSAIIDLSPSSNGSTVDRDLQHKHIADDEDDDAKSQSGVATEDTKVVAALSNEAGVLESQSKETNGISSVKDNATNDTDCGDNVDDESACDSKIILKRVDKDAAKDDKQGEGEDLLETEDTKSKINSLRD